MSTYPDGLDLEERPCPMGCRVSDTPILEGRDRIHNIPGTFRIVRCDTCGLMRTNPRPTAATIGIYYPDDYAPYLAGPQPLGRRSGIKARMRAWLGLDARRTPPVPPGTMLEIGCASGSYLEQMRAAGWEARGIEFSESAAQQARNKGFQVQTGGVETVADMSERFDMVAAWMVLEHLHDPIGALKRIRAWTKPEGYLIASVPVNSRLFLAIFGNASYDLHLPNHLYHYSTASIRRLLEQSGWRVEAMRWQRNPNTLLWTLEYAARDRGYVRFSRMATYVRAAPRLEKFRLLLGWLLGVTRSSGRVEIWARPNSASS